MHKNETVRGDEKNIPDAGAKTGVTDTYGSNLDAGYDKMGGIGGSTKSDPIEQSKSKCNDMKGGC